MRLFDENEKPTKAGKVLIAFCLAVFVAVIALGVYETILRILYFQNAL